MHCRGAYRATIVRDYFENNRKMTRMLPFDDEGAAMYFSARLIHRMKA